MLNNLNSEDIEQKSETKIVNKSFLVSEEEKKF